MTVAEAQRRAAAFRTGRMVEALRSIDYRLPPFGGGPGKTSLGDAARGKAAFRHVVGASDWRTDSVQMRRYLMLEMVRFGVALSPALPAAQSDDGRLA